MMRSHRQTFILRRTGAVAATFALAILAAGCTPRTGPVSTSLLGSAFDVSRTETVAVMVDGGIQSRVPAENVLGTLRLFLLYYGYRPVLVPAADDPLSAARAHDADALLRVNLDVVWETANVRRGSPAYLSVQDIPVVTVRTEMTDVARGVTLLRGVFRGSGYAVPRHDPSVPYELPRGAHVEDEWPLVLSGLAETLRTLPPRNASPTVNRRALRVAIAADEEARRRSTWEHRAASQVSGASRILSEEFGIALDVVAVRPWISSDRVGQLSHQLASMERQVGSDEVDVVIGLTGQPSERAPSSEARVSVSEPFGRAILIRQADVDSLAPALAEVIGGAMIVQEMTYLFGAPRAYGVTAPVTARVAELPLRFDERTRRILSLTRERSFDVPVGNVPVDTLETIYRRSGSEGAHILDVLTRAGVGRPLR